MTVFCVLKGYDYEGCELMAVHSTFSGAVARAENIMVESGYDTWHRESGEGTFTAESGSCTVYVSERSVQP